MGSGQIAQRGAPVQQSSGGGGGGLADVVELILDKGLVIDAFVRVSLIGIEILRIDARVVIASVDTYLRFAEACNRLDIANDGSSAGLPQMIGQMTESGAKRKTRGALQGAGETLRDSLGRGQDKEKAGSRRKKDEDDEEEQ
ncbi:gas vesicle structural protein GvpA [Actinoallomurus liliacearum]|uniref:Gas vesicle protein A n=1 Tax=Actinoallomurus liliacearum TaxID=1080073 RepID=A0ABP8TWZ9_9ACTN